MKTPKLVLLAMAFLAPIALYVYAPIMPALKLSLSTSADAIQLGMTLFLIFSLLGNSRVAYLWSCLEKKVLLWGVSIYIIGSVIGILVNDVYWLLIARVMQATGGGFSLLLIRSIILEQNSPNKTAAKLYCAGDCLVTSCCANSYRLFERLLFLALSFLFFVGYRLDSLVGNILASAGKKPSLTPFARGVDNE